MVWLVAQYSSITIPLQFFFFSCVGWFFLSCLSFFFASRGRQFFFVCCCFSISLSFLLLHARCSDPEIKACVLILSLLFYFTVYLAQQKKTQSFCFCFFVVVWNVGGMGMIKLDENGELSFFVCRNKKAVIDFHSFSWNLDPLLVLAGFGQPQQKKINLFPIFR